MSVTQTLRAVELFRSMGVPVTFENGWDTRGNGQSSAYQGGILHHTGGSYASTCPGILIYGRSDLSGPLCNFAGLTNGGIHVVAAHPANHAGASGGPSAYPFPITNLFNRLVMGLEICYPGASPMTDEQYRTAKVFAKVMEIMFGSVERARGHRETSVEGKWDPGWAPGQTINMAELRAAAANVEGDDVSAKEVWTWEGLSYYDPATEKIAAGGFTSGAELLRKSALYTEKAWWYAIDNRQMLLQLAGKPQLTAAEVAAEIRPGLAADLMGVLGAIVKQAIEENGAVELSPEASDALAEDVVERMGSVLSGAKEDQA